eukprot:4147010-Amphidinium_carterae.1
MVGLPPKTQSNCFKFWTLKRRQPLAVLCLCWPWGTGSALVREQWYAQRPHIHTVKRQERGTPEPPKNAARTPNHDQDV